MTSAATRGVRRQIATLPLQSAPSHQDVVLDCLFIIDRHFAFRPCHAEVPPSNFKRQDCQIRGVRKALNLFEDALVEPLSLIRGDRHGSKAGHQDFMGDPIVRAVGEHVGSGCHELCRIYRWVGREGNYDSVGYGLARAEMKMRNRKTQSLIPEVSDHPL
jgi:hypothetical protein